MTLNIPPDQLKEIADYLDSGMKCFVHKTTGELIYYPDGVEDSGNEEFWEDQLNKLEENPDDYVEFEQRSSRQSFSLMEDFIGDEISDKETQKQFYEVLKRRKPFQQFKEELFDHGDLRQKWFAYKDKKNLDWVQEQLDDYNGLEDEDMEE